MVNTQLVRKYKGNLRSVVKKGKADFAMSVLIQTGKSLRKSRECSLDHGKRKVYSPEWVDDLLKRRGECFVGSGCMGRGS